MRRIIGVSLVTILVSVLLGLGSYLIWPETTYGSPAGLSPDEVVLEYYRWYQDSIGVEQGGDSGSPLQDRAYQQSQYLSNPFIKQIDRVLETNQFDGYDPILCSRDVPDEIRILGTFQIDNHAKVAVGSSIPGHFFTVETDKKWGQWKITGVTCGSSPAGLTNVFYTWYLGYLDRSDGGEFNNPLVDQAYQNSGMLSNDYIRMVNAALSSSTRGGFDPILRAQDIPTNFYVVGPGPTDQSALVYLVFGSDFTKILQVEVITEHNQLVIDQIRDFMP